MNNLGLYIHIPFCEKKCDYCDFNSQVADKKTQRRYMNALTKQLEQYSLPAAGSVIDTVFIGGGTPTCIDIKELTAVIKRVKKLYKLSQFIEFTVEANPHSALPKKLKELYRAGVNRISLGLQSADDEELKALGRLHTYSEFEECYRAAKKAGFSNINVDLIYGLPDQSTEGFLKSLRTVIDLAPQHISCYGLKVEEGTPFYQRREKLNIPDEEVYRDIYLRAIEMLESAGYLQYEISNFAKRGLECRHNLKYWRCEGYLGLGAGSHSYFAGKRFSFVRDIEKYISGIEQDKVIVDEYTEISDEEMLGEYVMLMLRTKDGIDFADFYRRFFRSFEQLFGEKAEKYIKTGHMKRTYTGVALTSEGFLISNYILADLLNTGNT